MTEKALEYCMRGIVRYLDGDVELFKSYVNKAIQIEEILCECGAQTIDCRYDRKRARICTECGRVFVNKKVVRKCLVNSRRAS